MKSELKIVIEGASGSMKTVIAHEIAILLKKKFKKSAEIFDAKPSKRSAASLADVVIHTINTGT